MALKDLLISHDELTEQQIEELIEPYVRFDPITKAVVLLPSATALSNRQRVIAYLIALRGWPFVLPDDPPPTSCAPAELEAALQIAGGTLRPILKELKDNRLLQVSEGRYSANPVTFPFLKEQFEVGRPGARSTGSQRKRPAKARTQASSEVAPEAPSSTESSAQSQDSSPPEADPVAKKRRVRRDATASGAGPKARLRELIAEGWFSTPRPTRDIVAELAVRGATYRGQDLTRQLQDLVRARELRREKRKPADVSRTMWCYSNA